MTNSPYKKLREEVSSQPASGFNDGGRKKLYRTYINYESKKEILHVPRHSRESGNPDKIEEIWTGDYIFENEWQSFRTKNYFSRVWNKRQV